MRVREGHVSRAIRIGARRVILSQVLPAHSTEAAAIRQPSIGGDRRP